MAIAATPTDRYIVKDIALAQWGPYLELAVGRRNLLLALDASIRRVWTAIPVDRGIVLWEGDRLNGYQLFLGEKPGLRLIRPSDLTVPMSRERFTERFGFSPALSPESVEVPTSGGPSFVAFEKSLASRLSLGTHQPVILLSPSSGEVTIVWSGPSVPMCLASPKSTTLMKSNSSPRWQRWMFAGFMSRWRRPR